MSQNDPSRNQDSATSPDLPESERTEQFATLNLPADAPTEAIAETLIPSEHDPHTDIVSPSELLHHDPHQTNCTEPESTAGISVPPAGNSVTAPLSAGPVTAVTLDSEPPPPSVALSERATLDPSEAPAPTVPAHRPLEDPGLPAVTGYEVIKELGRGGMGVVYKARHKKLNRIVALKMVLGGHRSNSALQRFHAEAEAVARFQHPGIVQVYEIGQHGDQPYFSLEFIAGGTLSDRVERTPQPPLEAARLVQRLAEAMDYAHRRGILHRDLKPANILLDGAEGEPGSAPPPLSSYVPKITDFGLAKELEGDSGQTRDGAVMGTPSYMAPEQAQGKIRELGPTADVYSLGAILYELLTGVPPFLGGTVVDTLSQVVEREPLPPRRMQPKCPHDLQTICLKCLEKDAKKRYGSASGLAEDLRRYCANEPIRARPTPAWERGWKWAKRRPAAASMALFSVLALLGFGAGGMVLARIAESHREIAEKLADEEETRRLAAEDHARKESALREKAEREHIRAEENFKQARGALQELVLVGQNDLAKEPHLEKIRQTLMREALAFHRNFLRINGADPEQRLESARTQRAIAEIEKTLGQQAPAEKSFRASIGSFQELLAQHPGQREPRLELALAWNGLALLLQELQQPEEAGKAFHEAVTAAEQLHREQSDELVRFILASGYNDRGSYYLANNRAKEAEQDYLRALPLVQQLHDGASSLQKYRRQLALTHFNLGTVWSVMRQDKAEEAFGKSIPLWQSLHDQKPESPHYREHLAAAILNRGTLRHLKSRPREAEPDYLKASELLAELADLYRGVPDYRRLLVNADGNLSDLLKNENRPREAEKICRRYVSVLAGLAKEFPKETALRQRLGRGHSDLAITLFKLRRHTEAETSWRDGIAVQEKLVAEQKDEPNNWADLLDSLSNLADALASQSASEAAEKARREAVAAHEKRVQVFKSQPAHLLELAESQHALSRLLLERKEPMKASAALDGAVRAQLAAVKAHPKESKLRETLAAYCTAQVELLLRQGSHAAAGAAVEQALAVPGGEVIPGEQAAVFLAQCLTLAEKEAQKQAYGDRAMEALKRAVQRGYKDRKALESNPDFAPLRQRPDFQQLLRQFG